MNVSRAQFVTLAASLPFLLVACGRDGASAPAGGSAQPAPAPAGLALTRGPPAMARPAAWAPWVAAVRPCAPGKRAGLALVGPLLVLGGVVAGLLGSCARCGGRWGTGSGGPLQF